MCDIFHAGDGPSVFCNLLYRNLTYANDYYTVQLDTTQRQVILESWCLMYGNMIMFYISERMSHPFPFIRSLIDHHSSFLDEVNSY